jgi:hypothetical protein
MLHRSIKSSLLIYMNIVNPAPTPTQISCCIAATQHPPNLMLRVAPNQTESGISNLAVFSGSP